MPTGHAQKPFHRLQSLYVATPALAATVESLVTDVRYPVLIRFPVIAQHSKVSTTFLELLV